MKRFNRAFFYFVVVFAIAIDFLTVVKICKAYGSKGEMATEVNDVNNNVSAAKPMIIWFHSGATYSVKSLETALSSGLITHVILLYMHRADADWKTNVNVRKAIEVVKKSNAKLIWCRALWPYYANEAIRLSDFFDPNYYVQEVQALRSEVKEIGADFACLDNEAYGNSRMKYYLKGPRKPTSRETGRLRRAIEQAVTIVGKIDFTMHAGWQGQPYFALLANLADNRICEETYWFDEKRYKVIKYPYEIFGAYINTTRQRPEKPSAPYFLVSDVFEQPHLWSNRKGVFLYTDKRKALAVAKELLVYANKLPRTASTASESPNSQW